VRPSRSSPKSWRRLRSGSPATRRTWSGPDRALPGPRPAAGGGAVVPQARAYPAPAVRAVRRPGHRRSHLSGHHDLAHSADRQRRAHRRGRRPGPGDDLGPGRGRDRLVWRGPRNVLEFTEVLLSGLQEPDEKPWVNDTHGVVRRQSRSRSAIGSSSGPCCVFPSGGPSDNVLYSEWAKVAKALSG
jgi:hypothetical protein